MEIFENIEHEAVKKLFILQDKVGGTIIQVKERELKLDCCSLLQRIRFFRPFSLSYVASLQFEDAFHCDLHRLSREYLQLVQY